MIQESRSLYRYKKTLGSAVGFGSTREMSFGFGGKDLAAVGRAPVSDGSNFCGDSVLGLDQTEGDGLLDG